MKTLLGYANKIGVQPGGTIEFKVSSEDERPYQASIVRLIHADTNPAGPGYRERSVPDAAWRLPGRRQSVRPGSCVIVPATPLLRPLGSFALDMLIWPTLPGAPGQVIASLWNAARACGFKLVLEGNSGLALHIGNGSDATEIIGLDCKLLPRHWYRVHVAYDSETGQAIISQDALLRQARIADSGSRSTHVGSGRLIAADAPLVFGAALAEDAFSYSGFFNGKLEAPCLHVDGALAGQWDFSIGIAGTSVHDTGPHALHGLTWQGPARGVTGHAWDGTDFLWRHRPAHYAAIHFHADDLEDAGWATDFSWQVPDAHPSGLYAARLQGADDEDYIPFVVRPKRGTSTADLVFIVPTASYIAYANEHLAIDAALAERVHDHLPAFGPNDLHLAAHRELGGSLYDVHDDGSGIMTSSRHRPILNMRPKYQSWLGGTGSALWQLAADTHILDWLDARGIACDCITDEDVHAEGAALLGRYRCVMTGTHAEYWSTPMLDALQNFRDSGGRIMHMGANGLYWRIAFHPSREGIIEVRRAEVGNGWITPPGEAAHAYTGEPGGLWRRLGRAPQALVGVGFVGQGFDISSYYRRLPDSFDARAEFIFAGIPDDVIGDFGLIGGGAAGLELDRSDPALGTPPNALILARSEHHTRNYLPTVEDLLINYAGQAALASVCAELVFFETPSGGAVFSTGSIAWSGSLSHHAYDNNVSRITENVLRRFLDPAPFETQKDFA
jgi:N,N-dimethylformamidase